MFGGLLGKKEKAGLAVDVGSSAIKIVELVRKNQRLSLNNYALAQLKGEAVFKLSELKEKEVAEAIKSLMREAGIEGRRASFSLPVEKTFSTIIDLPAMPKAELVSAINFEARKYVPVPLEEVTLDWSVLPPLSAAAAPSERASSSGRGASLSGAGADKKLDVAKSQDQGVLDSVQEPSLKLEDKAGAIQILLVAVPKAVVESLMRIAALAGLEIRALEQEAFSLARALVGNDQQTYLLVGMGEKTSDMVIVDQGVVRMTYDVESINREIVLMEIDRIANIYQMRYNRKIGQCLMAGGRAGEKENIEFFSGKLKMPYKVGDPFARIAYRAELAPAIKEIGPQMAVAIGLAMREG